MTAACASLPRPSSPRTERIFLWILVMETVEEQAVYAANVSLLELHRRPISETITTMSFELKLKR